MSTKKLQTSRRKLLKGTAATAAIAPFFIGRSAKAAEETLKFATVAPPGTPWAAAGAKIKKVAAEASGGDIKMKMFFGGAMGGEKEIVQACTSGRLSGIGTSMGALAQVVPELAATELPYLVSDAKAGEKMLMANQTMIHDLLWDAGLKLVMLTENGTRSIGTRGRAVNTPADLKGLKIRTQESKWHIYTFKTLGAKPVPMGVTEVLSSLQTGVIDGYDNTKVFAMAAGWQKGVEHWCESFHIYQGAAIVFSKLTWEKLAPEVQEALSPDSEAIKKITKRTFRKLHGMESVLRQNLIDSGLEVTTPDLGPWQKLGRQVQDAYRKQASKSGAKLLDGLRKAT